MGVTFLLVLLLVQVHHGFSRLSLRVQPMTLAMHVLTIGICMGMSMILVILLVVFLVILVHFWLVLGILIIFFVLVTLSGFLSQPLLRELI